MMRETSLEAFKEFKESGCLSRARLKAYELVVIYGPATAQELWRKANASPAVNATQSNLRARLNELREMGMLKECGSRPCNITGAQAIVWDVTDLRTPRPYKQPRSTAMTKKQALTQVERLARLVGEVLNVGGWPPDGDFHPPQGWEKWADDAQKAILDAACAGGADGL